MNVHYFNKDGEWNEGILMIDGVPVDEDMLKQLPFFKAVAAAERDLIARYDCGDLE